MLHEVQQKIQGKSVESREPARSRAGLFITSHPQGTFDSAARDSAAILTATSRAPWRTRGKRQILFCRRRKQPPHDR